VGLTPGQVQVHVTWMGDSVRTDKLSTNLSSAGLGRMESQCVIHVDGR